VNTNDDPDWGFATSYIQRKDYPSHWERGDGQPYICFIIGKRIHNWYDVLDRIPEAMGKAGGDHYDWVYHGDECTTLDMHNQLIVHVCLP
jgi:hypothetical protein